MNEKRKETRFSETKNHPVILKKKMNSQSLKSLRRNHHPRSRPSPCQQDPPRQHRQPRRGPCPSDKMPRSTLRKSQRSSSRPCTPQRSRQTSRPWRGRQAYPEPTATEGLRRIHLRPKTLRQREEVHRANLCVQGLNHRAVQGHFLGEPLEGSTPPPEDKGKMGLAGTLPSSATVHQASLFLWMKFL